MKRALAILFRHSRHMGAERELLRRDAGAVILPPRRRCVLSSARAADIDFMKKRTRIIPSIRVECRAASLWAECGLVIRKRRH
jgi:hypothetical protein